MRSKLALLSLAALPVLALAQAAKPVTEFPTLAVALTPDEAVKALNGKSFSFQGADGAVFRYQLKENGYFFVNTPAGSTSGTWVIKDRNVCMSVRGDRNELCSELRRDAGRIFLQRASNKEVVELKFAE